MKKLIYITLAVTLIFFPAIDSILACSVSVSEYVMQNHYPDMNELIYFYKSDKVDEAVVKKHENLKELFEDVNVNIRHINTKKITSKRLKYLYDSIEKKQEPFYALFNGNYFHRVFTPDEKFKDLADSPLRKKIEKELKKRPLYTLLILKTGNSKKDRKAVKVVKKFLKENEFEPEIKYFELSKDDPKEQFLVKQLLKVETDLENLKEPMVFGIYGKLRALEPLVGEGISEDNFQYLTDFLASDCSCLIKGQLPGVDLIHTYNWDDEY